MRWKIFGRRLWIGVVGMIFVGVGGWLGMRVRGDGTGAAATQYATFTGLPAATRQVLAAKSQTGGGRTIALLGNLSPVNQASAKYLKLAVGELNLLRPEAVFTVGNLVQGETRSGQQYADEALAVDGILDGLKMPWHACVGTRDVMSGTRDVSDRRFEGLFKKYFGPLYYSTDVGNVHVIVLDSEEGAGAGNAIGDEQLAWLKADLDKTFDAKGTAYVVVLVHRPLWQTKGGAGNWDRVHELLVDFNRRPVISVEGMESAGSGARVVAVYAGGTGAYSEEPVRDGIHYVVLGATSARLPQDAAVEVRGFMLLKFDAVPPARVEGLGVHAAVVEMGGDGPGGAAAGTIVGPDIITARERTMLNKIAAIPNDWLGVQGEVDLSGKGKGLKLLLGNPLEAPLDVELRLASLRYLSTATLRENANPYAESFDAGWQLTAPYLGRHLEPKVRERYQMGLACSPGDGEVVPPEVEFVVHWGDERGRVHDVILRRKVGVVRRIAVAEQAGKISLNGDEGWDHAAGGGTYVWDLRGDEPQNRGGEWEMAADAKDIYLRVQVEDGMPSYGGVDIDSKWGGIASDAVSLAWAPAAGSEAAAVKRIWILPFGPAGAELWHNRGMGERQTKLQRLGEQTGVKAGVVKDPDGYVATLIIPRAMMLGTGSNCVMNVSVFDNDGGARTWGRSWVREGDGPAEWGKVTVTKPQPATQGATTRAVEPTPDTAQK